VGFRRAVVLDEGDNRTATNGQLTDEPVVRVGVAEHPAAAVHVEDHGQHPDVMRRADDLHADIADVGRNRDPVGIDGELVDGRGLHVVEHLASLGRSELVQERRLGGRLDELLRGLLEHDGCACGRNGHACLRVWARASDEYRRPISTPRSAALPR
jgi:hypothetical protein